MDTTNNTSGNLDKRKFLERIFSGKTLSEIETMFQNKKQINSNSGDTLNNPKFSVSNSLDFIKPVRPDLQTLLSGFTKQVKSVKEKHYPIQKPKDLIKPESVNFRKSGSTQYSGQTITQNLKSTKKSINISVDNSSTDFISGTVDYSFPAGEGYGFDNTVYAIAQSSDGKIYVGGDFSEYNSYDDYIYSPYLVCLNSDGSINFDFDCGYLDGNVYAIAVQPDGKIIIGGNFTYYNYGPGYDCFRIARLNPDGNFDETFFIGIGFGYDVYSIVTQSDGKILVGGAFTSYNGTTSNRIIRLNPNGSIDNTFNIDTGFDNEVYSIKIQSDGKILVGGQFTDYNGNTSNSIIRLNPDGSIENTFNIGVGISPGYVNSIDLQSDGKIIVGGNFYDTGYYDYNPCNSIIRLNTDGSLDNTFGFGVFGDVRIVKVQPDDKILVGGNFSGYMPYYNDWTTFNVNNLIRFNSDCSFDYSFYYDELFNSNIFVIDLQSNGKILVGGWFDNGGNPSVYPLNYFGRLYNSISKYKYTYAVTFDCGFNYKTYSVGSNTLFTPNDDGKTISFKSIHDEVNYLCGTLNISNGNEIYPFANPDYIHLNTYDFYDCETCQSQYYNYVQGFNPLTDDTDYFIVDKKFKVGDFFHMDETFESLNSRVKGCFQITTIEPYDFIPMTPINYVPYLTCEECVEANGVYYYIQNIDTTDELYILSNQYLDALSNPALLIPNAPTNSNFVKYSEWVVNANTTIVPNVYSTESFIDESNPTPQTNIVKLQKQMGDGQLDLNFNGSFINNDNSGFNNVVFSIAIQSDGKLLVGGAFTSYNGNTSNYIIRLNSDGSIDNTFNIGTGFNYIVNTIAIQSDGKILVGGDFGSYDGNNSNSIIRLNSDGSIDNTFNVGTGFNSTVYTIIIQLDGKILISGDFNTYDGNASNSIIRLNSDGSIDNTFNVGTGFNDTVNFSTIQSDGKILVGGWFNTYNGNTSNKIIRLNPDSSIDNTFNIGTGFDDNVNSISIQPDGKIIVGGSFSSYNGNTSNRIIRLNSDGSIDNTFNVGSGFDSQVNTITIQSDGKILVGGNFVEYDGNTFNYIIRLNSNGSVDNTFDIGTGFNDFVYPISIQSDGKILVGGVFTDYDGNTLSRIVRLKTNGSLDTTFYRTVGLNNRAVMTKEQSDGKILAVGEFTKYNGTTSNYIIRLNSDGSIDNTFNVGTGFDSSTYCVTIQSDGKILVGSYATIYNGIPINYLTRLNPDGSIDTSFAVDGTGFNDEIYSIEVQSDGKILVGGFFTSYNGNSSNRIIRLNPDGSIDYTFNIGTGFDGPVYSIAIQSDGKILVGGYFTTYDGNTSNYIIRLNSDGTIDNTFNIGSGFNSVVTSIAIQPNGKILVGGYFDDYNGNTSNYIIRLNSDGSIDNTFNIGSGFNSGVFTIAIQSNGKILVGGYFDDYNGNTSYGIIRLNSDGSPDLKFLPVVLGDGTNDVVYNVNILSDGNTLVSGYFNNYFNDKVGSGGSVMKIYTNQDYKLSEFVTCNNNQTNFLYVPSDTQTLEIPIIDLRLTFDDIANANSLVGDASDVNDWNAYFVLPTNGNPFTSVEVVGNEVRLFGGSNITLRSDIFGNNDHLISIIDGLGCIVSSIYYTFANNPVITTINLPELTYLGYDNFAYNCPSLVNVNLPKITSLESSCFEQCSSLTSVYFPSVVSGSSANWFSTCTSLTTIDLPLITNVTISMDGCESLTTINLPSCTDLGGTVGDDGVFNGITGNNITLTVPFALMTCNSGSPDGDIQYLQANNTVTIITTTPPINPPYISPSQTNELILKGVVNTTESICGSVYGDLNNTSFISGSNYFSGDDSLVITNSYDGLYPRTQDFTIEWFQLRKNNDQNSRPFSLGSYGVEITIAVSFENGTDFNLWLNDKNYDFGNLNDLNELWSHFVITRKNNLIRVFYNGNEIFNQNEGKPILFMGDLNNSNNDDITIGNEYSANSAAQFQGYITNFRWTLGTAIYTSNFEVPRNPLTVLNGTKVLMLSSTEGNLLTNFADNYFQIQQTNWNGGPTDFDTNNPFDNGYGLFKNNVINKYDNCTTCLDTFMYKSIMYVRDGVRTPWIERHSIKSFVIDDFKSKGPIFTLRAPECYEILNYFY